jgi:hypothetical protein
LEAAPPAPATRAIFVIGRPSRAAAVQVKDEGEVQEARLA